MKDRSICFITMSHPMFNLGGAEIQTWYYARAFSRMGWTSYFISPVMEKITHEFDDDRIKLLLFERTENSLKETLQVITFLVRIRPCFVFYRNIRYQYGLIVLFCRIFLGTRFIFSTMFDPLSGAGAATFTRRKRHALHDSRLHPLIAAKFHLQDWIFRTGVRFSDLHMVQNAYQLATVKKEFSRDGFIIHNNTLVPEYQSDRERLILFIATLKEFKRPEIFCKLADECRGKDYRFVLIGQNYGDPELASEFLSTVSDSNVEYIGQLPFGEVNRYLERAKLLVNTSSFEGFPNTFVQAWARGVPVISLTVDPDCLIRNHALGLHCENRFDLLVSHTIRLMEHETEWKRYSMQVYGFAREHLDTMTVTEQLISLIQTKQTHRR